MMEIVSYSDEQLAKRYASLANKNKEELSSILPNLIYDTETYTCDLRPKGKNFALNVLKDFQEFQKHVLTSHQKDNKMMRALKKLEKMWKFVDKYYEFEIFPEEEVKEKKGTVALKWFKENNVLFPNNEKNIDNIRLTYKKAGIKFVSPEFAMLTIDMLKKPDDVGYFGNWKRILYTYDDENKCCVLFSNDEYFVDQYGNFFLKEEHAFQFIQRLNGYESFTSQDGECCDVLLNFDYEFLQDMLPSFRSIKKDYTFSNFLTDMKDNESKAMSALLQMKSFSRFFCDLNDSLANDRNQHSRAYFSLIGTKINIALINLSCYEIITRTFLKDYAKFTLMLNDLSKNKSIPYETTIKKLVKNVSASTLVLLSHDIHLNLTPSRQDYINVCFQIAEKILEYLKKPRGKKETLVNEIQLEDLKYTAYWVGTKFQNEHDAVMKFTSNAERVKQEFGNLLLAVINCKNTPHKFSNRFSAAYHFAKHYTSIRTTLQENAHNSILTTKFPQSVDFPELNNRNKKACATYFFKFLPDFIFEGTFRKTPGLSENGSPTQLYVFEKTEIPIKGVMSKILDANNNPVEGRGDTRAENDCLTGAFIESICKTPDSIPQAVISQRRSRSSQFPHIISPQRRGPKRKAKRQQLVYAIYMM